MYSITLSTHNIVRWIVVLAGLWAAYRAWSGWLRRGTWTPMDTSAGKLFANAAGLQLILGLILMVTSPLVREGFADMGAAMGTRAIRFFIVEHPVMMIAAVALAHVGLARVRRATTDAARFQAAAIFWGLAIAAVLGGMPWERRHWPF